MPAEQIRDLVGEEIWKDYYKFATVRNPFDKTVSAYFHGGKKSRMPLRDLLTFRRGPRSRFLSWLQRTGVRSEQGKLTVDGELCLDGWIRFEHLKSDVEATCRTLGLPWHPDQVLHLKGEHRDRSIKLRSLYSRKAMEIVRTQLHFEFKEFGYSSAQLPEF